MKTKTLHHQVMMRTKRKPRRRRKDRAFPTHGRHRQLTMWTIERDPTQQHQARWKLTNTLGAKTSARRSGLPIK